MAYDCTTIKKNELLPCTTWMDSKNIRMSGKGQTPRALAVSVRFRDRLNSPTVTGARTLVPSGGAYRLERGKATFWVVRMSVS